MILLVCSFAAALIFVWARLSVVMRRVRDLASQLELLADLEGNGQIRLHYDDRLLRGAAEKPNSILALLRREKVRIENADAALQRAMPGWSHDLRTPPTAVREYIALLQKQPQTEDDVRYLDVVARRLKTLEATLDDLFSFSLALSSAGTMPVEPVNLGAKTELATAAFYDAWVDRGLSIDVATPDRRSGCGLLSMRSGAYCTTCSPTPRNTRVASFVRVWADASGSVVVENDAEHFDPTLLHELLDLGQCAYGCLSGWAGASGSERRACCARRWVCSLRPLCRKAYCASPYLSRATAPQEQSDQPAPEPRPGRD